MANPTIFQNPTIKPSGERSRFGNVLRRFRFPIRENASLETAAAQTRAARLFAVNFRHTWTR